MLVLDNLKKDFSLGKDQLTHVLKGLSVQFRQCEFVSILGPSGCGKTTLLNLIGGLDKCSSGDVYLDGVSTKTFSDGDWNDYRNKQIGFVFQSYNLIQHQTVLRNVEMPLILAEVPEEERKQRALAALEKVGLRDQAKKKPMQMSGGQMQRVAIARAIVNDPSIILADEPTGALDSESGLQVMDILKEISKEKLVIMVTHNDILAEQYSTRIIRMNDGMIIGDTHEYTLEECLADEDRDRLAWEEEENKKLLEKETKKRKNTKPGSKETAIKKAVTSAQKKVKKISHSLRKKKSTHMSFGTAFKLSASNLNSKKIRSLLTSLASSIGIIGIMLVLCLSNGATGYIKTVEESALSMYPLTVSESNTIDFASMMGYLMEPSDAEKNPDSDVIIPKEVLINLLPKFLETIVGKTNDLAALKTYVEENFDEKDGYVRYEYGVDFSVFCNYANQQKGNPTGPYMQVDPFLEGMTALFDKIPGVETMLENAGLMDFFKDESQLSAMFNVWEQFPENMDLVHTQYELVGDKSRWPTNYDEVVIIVDNQNQIMDFSLFALGMAGEDDVAGIIFGGDDILTKEYTTDDFLNLEYRLMTNSDYYQLNEDGTWDTNAAKKTGGYDYRRAASFVEAEGRSVPVKVVGVIRPKKGVTTTCMNGMVGYSPALVEYLSNRAMQSEVYKAQSSEAKKGKAMFDYPDAGVIGIAEGKSLSDKDYNDIISSLGIANFNKPTKINFYANSFDGKDAIDKLITDYNREQDANVEYSDMLGMITMYIDSIVETVTYVLVAFAGISLIVSSIMIAILIYTSVLERKKEIGVLRSIGARKKDISTVFISESAILGTLSGAIAIFISYVLSLIINVVLDSLLGVTGLATILWWHPVMMILISISLAVLAGFVPARVASNKHPVECLRSE